MSRNALSTWITLLVGIAALYFGADLLMPLTLAVLVAFALSPLVDMLERLRLGRIPAVVAVLLGIGLCIGGLGWVVGHQAATFASNMPQYRSILREKVRDLRGPIGSLSDTADEIAKLGDEIENKDGRPAARKVEVVEEAGVLDRAAALLTALVGPLGTAGIVVVLALFLLLEREELRDRMIWLIGAQDLSLTTAALDDATRRVTRYLAMQSLVCGIHGLAVGIGLAAIGVPGAVLWGALAGLLRFLPYFGPWIGAALPIAVATAAFHGWTQPLLTLGLVVALELVTNNMLEPWLYGGSVGLSPFGVVFAAVFWTWLWGIPGLIIATPLTACLAVAGRYVHAFRYFHVLLGDEPALAPDMRLYQRLLALDLDEAALVLREALATGGLEEVSDLIVLPVLRRLAEDDQRNAFPEDQTDAVRERLAELLSEVGSPASPASAGSDRVPVLFVASLDENDALAGRWVAGVCAAQGVVASFASPHLLASEIVERVAKDRPAAVCISALTPRSAAHARNLCKRLAAASEAAPRPILGLWAAPSHALGPNDGAARSDRVLRIRDTAQLEAALASLRARGLTTPR